MDNKEALDIVLNLARLSLNRGAFTYREGPATLEEVQAMEQMEFYHDEVMKYGTEIDPEWADPDDASFIAESQELARGSMVRELQKKEYGDCMEDFSNDNQFFEYIA